MCNTTFSCLFKLTGLHQIPSFKDINSRRQQLLFIHPYQKS
ncbi:unnamed protein product [Brugia timori]|uniref:Uncharacterized protein n=1 Tax=Brugia timori TaxID=42155 RepID=A0A0R3QEA4_9BILA|nr:unnamed protein product [Brugia timori]